MFDKKIIQKNFSRGAKKYDEAALIQKLAAKKLCDISLPFIKENSTILDLGSGTSFIAKNLIDKKNLKIFEIDLSAEMLASWKDRPSNVVPIQGDIENLPFDNNSFDVIISSFSLQWVNDLEKTFTKIFASLKPNGIFAFCIPTSESLQELRAGNVFKFNDLPKVSELKSAALKAGFFTEKFEINVTKQSFSNALEALKSIKEIGANYSNKQNTLINKSNLKQFDNFCLKNSHLTNRNSNFTNFSLSWNEFYLILSK
jgi:malonyl-CoA O-methyltransferase